ncbi:MULTISPECIES: SDR family oxidoreductase [unclassified Arthrobacter]|uniref:SDR family oxidoreductase n=1 Tax=unclassified Arthrobacter TaxID=235627 RepID=UPI001C854402|nr:SDR family oxidoreductase [Arthrobacter sp. MAHUQ-56]MBX7442961.1 SDR family oxidoreductase [Arthrobacter sp. MAHUQ-56]
MILVVGGTGRLGRAAVPLLVQSGHRVRIMARGSSQPFATAVGAGVELFRGDLGSESDCRRAVEGCTAVVFAASGFGLKDSGPREVDRDGAIRLVRAAAAGGVQHLIMMSMHGAAPDGPIDYLRCKAAAEEAVRSSGMDWTVIRMGALLEQRLEDLTAAFGAKGKVPVFGSGSAPVTFTSVQDAAAVVLRAVRDPALRNRIIEWGSQTLTGNQLAEAVLARAGHGSVQRIPPAALRLLSVAARPFSPFLARVAGAGVWQESGAGAFDFGPGRADFPDIPITGLQQVLEASGAPGSPV